MTVCNLHLRYTQLYFMIYRLSIRLYISIFRLLHSTEALCCSRALFRDRARWRKIRLWVRAALWTHKREARKTTETWLIVLLFYWNYEKRSRRGTMLRSVSSWALVINVLRVFGNKFILIAELNGMSEWCWRTKLMRREIKLKIWRICFDFSYIYWEKNWKKNSENNLICLFVRLILKDWNLLFHSYIA